MTTKTAAAKAKTANTGAAAKTSSKANAVKPAAGKLAAKKVKAPVGTAIGSPSHKTAKPKSTPHQDCNQTPEHSRSQETRCKATGSSRVHRDQEEDFPDRQPKGLESQYSGRIFQPRLEACWAVLMDLSTSSETTRPLTIR